MHFVAYSVHLGATKMYHSIRDLYWWDVLKKDVADYNAKYLTCQQVKAEHQKPSGKLQPFPILEWKWERIIMNFVVGLPRSKDGYNCIWVIVDRLTKSAHFLPVKATYSVTKLAKLYVKYIVCLFSLYLIEVLFSPLDFSRNYRKQWAPDLISVLLFILIQMVNLRGRSRHLRIC